MLCTCSHLFELKACEHWFRFNDARKRRRLLWEQPCVSAVAAWFQEYTFLIQCRTPVQLKYQASCLRIYSRVGNTFTVVHRAALTFITRIKVLRLLSSRIIHSTSVVRIRGLFFSAVRHIPCTGSQNCRSAEQLSLWYFV